MKNLEKGGASGHGYTDAENPFGDAKVTERFVWGKKIEKQLQDGADVRDLTSKAEAKRQQERLVRLYFQNVSSMPILDLSAQLWVLHDTLKVTHRMLRCWQARGVLIRCRECMFEIRCVNIHDGLQTTVGPADVAADALRVCPMASG